MRTLTYVLKRKEEPTKVLSFLPGINEVGKEGQDVVSFLSPYYEEGEVLLYRGEVQLFDSQKVESTFFELDVLIKGFLETKAVFLLSPKGNEAKEITSKIASLSLERGASEKEPEEKAKELMTLLLETDCLFLSIDLSSELNRKHLDEARTLFYGYELPVLLFRSPKEKPFPMPRVEPHRRFNDNKDLFDWQKFLRKEWPTAGFLVLFPLIGSFALTMAGSLYGESEAGIATLLLVLAFFVYGMFAYIAQSLFQSYPTRKGLLASTLLSIASSGVGSLLALLLVMALSSLLAVEPFVGLMSFSYLGMLIMVVFALALAIWAYIKQGVAGIFSKKGKR